MDKETRERMAWVVHRQGRWQEAESYYLLALRSVEKEVLFELVGAEVGLEDGHLVLIRHLRRARALLVLVYLLLPLRQALLVGAGEPLGLQNGHEGGAPCFSRTAGAQARARRRAAERTTLFPFRSTW